MTRAPCGHACKPATADQEYIGRKRGLPDGLRVYRGPLTIAGQACAGSLVLPCSTLAGEVVSLQFIPTEGKKLFLTGLQAARRTPA
jgi:putative DNA primase/helicase